MRDILLTLFVLAGLGLTFRYPFVGLLLWVWFAIMNPHQEVYSFAHRLPWNLIIAIVTILSWLMSSERKLPPAGFSTVAVLTLLVWCTFNTMFAFDPTWSWTYWDRAWKMIAMCVLAATLTNNRVRFQALMWIVALSIAYYGVKGGLFTLIKGGGARVLGPPDTMMADNNELGLAELMTLPILNYLRLQSGSKFVRRCLVLTMVLTVVGIFGSYSRSAYITLAILALVFWFRTKYKFRFLAATAAVVVPVLYYMPQSFYNRAGTLQHVTEDASFHSHLESWWVAYRYAVDHFPFGAGFYGVMLPSLWDIYLPGEWHAAHSIYFQALGEQGFVGLALYLLVFLSGFLNLWAVRRYTRGKPEQLWAYNLAGAMALSFFAFCVGGNAAPMDFFDLPFLWVMVGAALLALVRQPAGQFGTAQARASFMTGSEAVAGIPVRAQL